MNDLGKIYSILTTIISTLLVIYFIFYNEIYFIYTIYYSESIWGILIAIFRQILFFESNLIYILIILVVIGFIGGIISKGYKDAIYTSIFSGVLFAIIWLILMVRFTPIYCMTYPIDFLYILTTIFRGLLISSIYLGPCFLGGYIISYKKLSEKEEEYPKIENICPVCHKAFISNPLYCCYCNNKIRD